MDLYTLALPLDASAGAALREWLRTVFDGNRLPESSLQEVLLAATEAVNAALRNGADRGASVIVTLSIVGRDVYVRVADRDRDRRPPSPTPAADGGDLGATRGLGLTLMNGAMDEVDLDHTADGISVRLVKRLAASESTSDVTDNRQAT